MKPTSSLNADKQPWINEQFGILYTMIGYIWLLVCVALHYLDVEESESWILTGTTALSALLVFRTIHLIWGFSTVSFNKQAVNGLLIIGFLGAVLCLFDTLLGLFITATFIAPMVLIFIYIVLVINAYQKRNHYMTIFHTMGIVIALSLWIYIILLFSEDNIPFLGLMFCWSVICTLLGVLLIYIARNMTPESPEVS